MFSAGKSELLLGRVYEPDEVIAEIDGVTEKDISQIAAKYADISEYSSVVVGKRELLKDEIGL
jgi:predicted Zn-dependent peptidase